MKILYITTVGCTMNFFKTFIRQLLNDGHTVDIATNETDYKVDECYKEWGCKIYPISCTRYPFAMGTIKAISQIRKIVKENDYELVHCHTPIAAMCTRIACIPSRKHGLKVFYTAHGFHFYKGAPLKNWLIYYPVEKICSYFTDVLITINQEDYALAKKKMKAKQIKYVPGVGIDTKKFGSINIDKSEKRKELGISDDAVVMMSVGELNHNKNHEVIIKALAKTGKKNIHYMIAGKGELEEYLTELSESLGVSSQVHILGYRTDIGELYYASDICVFPSIREGLPVALIEGMAVGLPLLVAENRGTRDCCIDNENAFICFYNDVEAFSNAIIKLSEDEALRKKMGEKNREISKRYDSEVVIPMLKKLYNL